jgi:hypothetical protein
VTAKWSSKRQQEERVARDIKRLAERLALLKLYRDNGWLVETYDSATGVLVAADTVGISLYWKVKMPGAYPVIVRGMDELRRKAGGLR